MESRINNVATGCGTERANLFTSKGKLIANANNI